MIHHKIINNICVNCNKSVDDLFIELVNMGNKDAGRFALSAIYSDGYLYEKKQEELVKKFHNKCLTEDELIIKDIIE